MEKPNFLWKKLSGPSKTRVMYLRMMHTDAY